MKAETIKTRYELARTRRQAIESEISDAYLHTSPAQDPIRVDDTVPNRDYIYDSTASDCVQTLVNDIYSLLLPRDEQWVRLTVAEAYKQALLGATADWDLLLERETQKLYDALNGSGFYSAASESLKDLVIAGTGCVEKHLDDDGIQFSSIPIKELYYLDTDTVFRHVEMTAGAVIRKWSKIGTIPAWVTELAKRNQDEKIEIIEVQVPGEARNTYEYAVYTYKGWEQIVQHKRDWAPFTVFRWDRTSGNVWGDSLIKQTLPEIKTLNRLILNMIKDADFAAQGAFYGPDPDVADLDILAGHYHVAQGDIKAFPFPGNFQVSSQLLQHYQTQIKLKMMQDDLPPASSRMTTVEVEARQAKFLRKIGVVALRIEEEFLTPVVWNTIRALQSVGKMEKFNIDDNPVRLETWSLAKRAFAQHKKDRMLGALAMASQLGSAGLMHIDLPATGRYLLELDAFPAHLLKPEAQVKEEIKAMNAVQAAGGAVAAMRGQSNQESTQATGQAIASLLGQSQ